MWIFTGKYRPPKTAPFPGLPPSLEVFSCIPFVLFGEGLRIITDNLDSRNFYAFNPAFDKGFRGSNSSNVSAAGASNPSNNSQVSAAAAKGQSNQQVSGATAPNPWNMAAPAMNVPAGNQGNQQVSGATASAKPWSTVSPATETAAKGQSNQQVSGAAAQKNSVSPAYTWNFK